MRKMFRVLFWVALIAGALLGVARATAIRWWRIPQGDRYLDASISPSLEGGDLILLWRLTAPVLGDLVLCPEPQHPERVVIGRIVAQGRDQVEVTGADVSRNGHRYVVDGNCAKRTFNELDPASGAQFEQSCSIENVNGVSSLRGELVESAARPRDITATNVPRDSVWLVSDNRLFPYDSRDFGPVPRDSCREKVFFRLVSKVGFKDADRRNELVR